jgi:hypothetical protein
MAPINNFRENPDDLVAAKRHLCSHLVIGRTPSILRCTPHNAAVAGRRHHRQHHLTAGAAPLVVQPSTMVQQPSTMVHHWAGGRAGPPPWLIGFQGNNSLVAAAGVRRH